MSSIPPTFNGSYAAFATWVRFKDLEADTSFRVLNVHYDYASRDNRKRSNTLVAERLRPWIAAGEIVFLAGDLNARLGSILHDELEAEGLTFLPVEGSTYHFNFGLNLFGAIDHIAHTDQAKPTGPPVVVREKFGDVWPTDHYPLVADFFTLNAD